ncbi:TolC family protein [Breznakiella homolactica]|uniref:TolC family protein n=1 Tax=Breznakiella homolactica TaxID=2798577 RepID=A0A7T7XP18_9SPIR|nr:TolC family protein [Breznakiella homolactica]QQO09866.1 TolC family protein [Breznakiella homolactica]
MKNKTVFLVCVFLVGTAFAAAAESLDVERAVALALENNLSLGRTKLETDGKKRTADRSWNSLIPTVTASGSVSHGTSLTGDLVPGRDEWTPGVSLSTSLNLSPSIVSNINKAKADYEAGVITYEAAKQDLELQVRKAFYQLLLLKANIGLTEQSIDTAQARYDQTANLARVGQASSLDELSARVDLENLKPNLRSAEARYENALDSFKQILGLPQDEEIALEGFLDDAAGTIRIEEIPVTGESYAIVSLRKSLEVTEAQKKAAWNQAYMPSLNLSWNTAPTYSNNDWSDNGQFSVRISLNLDSFLPWSSSREQIDSLNDSISNYESRIAEALMNSGNQIRQYQRTIEQSLENIAALRLNAELAERTYEMYETSYRNGTVDLQSLRSAGDSLLQARNKIQEEQYTLLSSILDLEKEINVPFGTLLDM